MASYQQSTVDPCPMPPAGPPQKVPVVATAGCLLDGCVHQLFIQGTGMLLAKLLGLECEKPRLAGAVLRPQPSCTGKVDNGRGDNLSAQTPIVCSTTPHRGVQGLLCSRCRSLVPVVGGKGIIPFILGCTALVPAAVLSAVPVQCWCACEQQGKRL